MLSLLKKIQFFFAICTLSICGLLFFSYQHFSSVKQISLEKDIYFDFYRLVSSKPRGENNLKQLQTVRKLSKNKNRQQIMKQVIDAYSSANEKTLQANIDSWLKFEADFFVRLNEKKQQVEKFMWWSYLGSLLINILTMTYVLSLLQKEILTPVQSLSRKINDFIDGHYAYNFNDTPDNEIGNLDRSFQLMAEKVIRNMEELKELDEAKSEFMNIVSHELRTPMTSIKGSLNLISAERIAPLPHKIKHLIKIAEDESNRMIRLINDLLDLAKIEAKSYELEKDWYLVDDVIQGAKEALEGLSLNANVNIEYKSNIEDLEIYVDKDKIKQVIVNLVSNAIKFSPEGAKVELSSKLDNECIMIEVRDYGPGIEPQHIESIFQKFRQANSPGRPLVKGTGLGLSIAKSLVEAHSGEIGVKSELGNGSVFFFTLNDFRQLESGDKEQVA